MASFDDGDLLNVNNLPEHILVQIFRYNKKDTNSLLRSRLVCRKWNYLIESCNLLSDVWFKFENMDMDKNHEFVRAVTENIVEVRNLRLTGCGFIWCVEDFMKALAKTIRNLDIAIANIDENWMAFFVNAKYLKTLVLNMDMYDSPQRAIDILHTNTNPHPFLKKIAFSGVIEEDVLDYFRKTAINVETLSFESDDDDKHGAIERMINDRLATIVDVELRLPRVPESTFDILSSFKVLQLKSFEWDGRISPSFEMFLRSQENMESLKLNVDTGNITALQHLRKLKNLYLIIKSPDWDFIPLDIANNKNYLEELYIEGNYYCSIVFTNLEQNLNLKLLRLGTAEDFAIHVDTIKAVTEKFPNLVSLNIKNCDAISLADICDKLVNLTELKICNNVTDFAFGGQMPEDIVKLDKLKVLEIQNFYNLFNDDILQYNFKLPSLEELNLEGSLEAVTFRGMLGIAMNCPNIKVLNVNGLRRTENNINELFEHMPNLEKIIYDY